MVKLMLERIKYLNDKEIMSIFNDNHVIQHRTKEEIKQLVELYKKYNKDEIIYKLITNFSLLYYRSNEEHLMLIKKFVSTLQAINNETTEKLRNRVDLYMGLDKFKQYMDRRYNELIQIITDGNILELRTFDEQMDLIEKYKNIDDINLCGAEVKQSKDFTYDIIVNKNILKNFNNEEQMEFIEIYSKEHPYNIDNMNEILNNKDLFEKRSFSEINGMLWLLSENNTDEKLYRLITDRNILLNRTCHEQTEIIAKYWEELQDESYFGLFIDKDILGNRNYKEQMQLIQLYTEQKTSDVYELIISENLLKNRSFEEQRDLIYKYLQTDLKEIVFDMLIDEKVSKALSYQEQLDVINSYFKPVNEDAQILNKYKEIVIDLRNTIVLKSLQIEELEQEVTKWKK